ncbi:hypothetical protein EKE94_13915 [Mesobaculum littorinae]|uniref:Uncharacterized protein n=1 Tax=Mesobaculum littorinae TaxID=2486419 RepID=A0A438AFZ8_9RHOB|nr:hypothetical protein [Mesobaculum littorinae]RVV97622.1 hypothetical protein EKE94_13915 [Mesobaculum littorinae]
MSNSLFLGADAQIRQALQQLRAQEGGAPISGEITGINDDIFLSNDPAANVTGDYTSGRENLISLKMQPAGAETPRWQALHLRMGACDLGNAGVIGFVARSQSPSAMITRACLRSGRDGQFQDTFFTKAIASFATPSTHLDAIDLDTAGDIPRTADWREFILFFRPGPVDIDLLDLRPFVV